VFVAVSFVVVVPGFGSMIVAVSVSVVKRLRVYVDQLSGERFALPKEPYGKHVARVEIVRIAKGNEFNRITQHRFPVVRSGFPDLENGFYVLGVPLVCVLV